MYAHGCNPWKAPVTMRHCAWGDSNISVAVTVLIHDCNLRYTMTDFF